MNTDCPLNSKTLEEGVERVSCRASLSKKVFAPMCSRIYPTKITASRVSDKRPSAHESADQEKKKGVTEWMESLGALCRPQSRDKGEQAIQWTDMLHSPPSSSQHTLQKRNTRGPLLLDTALLLRPDLAKSAMDLDLRQCSPGRHAGVVDSDSTACRIIDSARSSHTARTDHLQLSEASSRLLTSLTHLETKHQPCFCESSKVVSDSCLKSMSLELVQTRKERDTLRSELELHKAMLRTAESRVPLLVRDNRNLREEARVLRCRLEESTASVHALERINTSLTDQLQDLARERERLVAVVDQVCQSMESLEIVMFGESPFLRSEAKSEGQTTPSSVADRFRKMEELIRVHIDIPHKKAGSAEVPLQQTGKDSPQSVQHGWDTPRFRKVIDNDCPQFGNSSPYVMIDPSTMAKMPSLLPNPTTLDAMLPLYQSLSIDDIQSFGPNSQRMIWEHPRNESQHPPPPPPPPLHQQHEKEEVESADVATRTFSSSPFPLATVQPSPSAFSLCSGSSQVECCEKSEENHKTHIAISLRLPVDSSEDTELV